MNATAIRDEPISAATMKAVIIYDRFDLASKAKAMLERAGHRIPELSQFAGRHGLSLVIEDNALVADKSSTFASDLRQREVAVTATLERILAQPVRDPYEHWAIND